jgi:SAM-dependent methyltransferase
MYLDVVDLRNFYGEPLGRLVRRVLRARLTAMWPKVAGDRVMGLGYATPYLRPFRDQAERVIGLMPAPQGVVNWPSEGPSATALVHEDALPLPDSSIDRALLVHCLEMAENPSDVLREVWRVLAPGGRLIAVVPNRSGLWARMETTPFGHGRPFSRGQLDRLLKETLYSPIDWTGALYMAPFERSFLIRSGVAFERVGGRLWPALSGVVIVEATKQLYQGLPARARTRARLLPLFRPVPVLVPNGISPTPVGRAARPAPDTTPPC